MRKFWFFRAVFALFFISLLFGGIFRGSGYRNAWQDGYIAGQTAGSASGESAAPSTAPRGEAHSYRHHSPFGFLGLCLTGFLFFLTFGAFCKMFGKRRWKMKHKSKGWSHHWQKQHGTGKWDGDDNDSNNVPDYV